MKKLLSISWLLVVILLLVACGTTSNNDSGEVDDTEQSQSEHEGQSEEESSNLDDNKEDTSQAGNDSGEPEDTSNSSDTQPENNQEETFDKGRAKVVLTEYEKAFKKVINYTTENQELKEYSTKQELQEHFEHFVSTRIAENLVDTYFREENGGLYVEAKDAPVFLQEDKEFNFKKTSENSAVITQEQSNELMGNVNMEYKLKNRDGFWIIDEINKSEMK